MLSQDEIRRYSRHLIMPELGVQAQEKLKSSSVLMIGAGGLGSPLGLYLAAAGVGRLGIVDFDNVDFSNLQRQVLYETGDVGRPKLEAAKNRLRGLNPNVEIDLYENRLTSDNAINILKNYDVVADGTDNFPTRYLVNDASVFLKKPNVYASIFRFEGQASVFDAQRGPCYRCLYPVPPPPGSVPSCAEGGVLGILPGVMGTIQATETIKVLLGIGDPLIGRLMLYDALQMQFRELRLLKDPDCPVCSDHPSITTLIDYQDFCGIRPEPAGPDGPSEVSATDLKQRLDQRASFVLLDVRGPNEFEICRLPGARLIPLRELPARLQELNPTDEIVVYCHFGKRSQTAATILREAGFRNTVNLHGGIDAWSTNVDPSVPKY